MRYLSSTKMYPMIFCLLFVTALTDAYTTQPIVIVLSFDGFRYDFVRRGLTPVLDDLIHESAAPFKMKPIFPTKTHANHFTVATGLYAEDHGVINDIMFNDDGQPTSNTFKQYHQNDSVVPIWIENEIIADGYGFSGVMMWPGAEFSYQNMKPTYFQNYDRTIDYTTRVNTMISWIEDPNKPANLVMGYFDELNITLHEKGLDSQETESRIREVDDAVYSILSRIYNLKNGIQDRINLIILGGHGIDSVRYDGIIYLNELFAHMNFNNYIAMDANALVAPDPDNFDYVYNSLKNKSNELNTFHVYKQNEIPEHWHIKHSPQLNGKIFLQAAIDHGFSMTNRDNISQQNEFTAEFDLGMDGYDDNENLYMDTIFIAWGPKFNYDYVAEIFSIIEVHPLLKHLLNLTEPSNEVQSNDLMSENVKHMLSTTRLHKKRRLTRLF